MIAPPSVPVKIEKSCQPPAVRCMLREVTFARARLPGPALALLVLALAGCATYEPKPLAPVETAAAFEKRSLDAPALRAFIEQQLARELPVWPLKQTDLHMANLNHAWTLERLTLAAYYFHPSLDLARAQWQTALAAETSAGGRPNPTVSIQPGYNFNAASGVLSPWIPGATIDLPIETMGKRGLRIARAKQESEAARTRLLSMAWKVAAEVRDAWNQFQSSSHQLYLLDVRLGVQQRLVAKLEQRYRSGAAAVAEVLPARLAFQKSRLDYATAREVSASSVARLAEAVGKVLRLA